MRQYEKEHAEDLALKSLYFRQHQRDDLRSLFPNPEMDEEEAEAADLLNHAEKWANDGTVLDAEAASRDGNWGYGNEKEFADYDKYLHDHPEEEKDDCGTELCAPQSMLHISTLKETVANSPENRSKSRLQKEQSEKPPTRHY